jgi:hypothetical protein
MRALKIIIYTICCSVLFVSCEKEIDLDLKESNELFVIEGIVHDHLGDNYVLISKTRAFNNNGEIEHVSNAIVRITDDAGNIFNLSEVSSIPGYYTNSNLIGVEGRTYTLSVDVGIDVITATSVMNPRIEIDSLSYNEEPLFGDGEIEYSITCHFTDPANIVNYYRMKSFLSGEQLDGYVNWGDDAFDGRATGLPVFDAFYNAGDIATIQLLSVDEPNYRYFVGVASSQEGEVPGNPESNLSGEKAVGYFGAYAKSEISILIEE